MAKIKKTAEVNGADNNTHKGYNEKNPGQPQGAFKADSMDEKSKHPTNKISSRKKGSLK